MVLLLLGVGEASPLPLPRWGAGLVGSGTLLDPLRRAAFDVSGCAG
jgi:hypothetical protein